jgi:hypothetical protein
MMTRAGFTVCATTAFTLLFAGASLCADAPQSSEQQQTPLSGGAPAPPERAGGARPDPKLEQTRLRLERELQARRQMTGDFEADPDNRRRDMRFGVGYEFRMRGRQELGFDSPGGFAGGGAGPGAGGARGFGNGRR